MTAAKSGVHDAFARIDILIERRIRLCCHEHRSVMQGLNYLYGQFCKGRVDEAHMLSFGTYHLRQITIGSPARQMFGDRNVCVGNWKERHWGMLAQEFLDS
jgi:hypothetical protein